MSFNNTGSNFLLICEKHESSQGLEPYLSNAPTTKLQETQEEEEHASHQIPSYLCHIIIDTF